MASDIQIELECVSKHYGSIPGVINTNLRVAKGSFFSLLGPSGCGKSTILKLIAGFEEPSSGDVLVNGRNVAGVPPELRNIGLVFQNYALFPHMTVEENIGFGLEVRGVTSKERRKRVEAMLDIVELPGVLSRRPLQLSGGQQQRVALARALVVEPDVLLLDEPFGALDKTLRESMQLKLVEIQRKLGVTTIFVTHDQEEALVMSDEIAVMSAQTHTIEQVGSPREIYERPQSVHVSRFIGHANIWEEELAGDNGGDNLQTTSGLVLRRPIGWQHQRTVTVCVRPEKINIAPNVVDSAGLNSVAGTVRDAVFVGELTVFHVDTKRGFGFEIRRLNRDLEAELPPGAPVTLSWSPHSMVILS